MRIFFFEDLRKFEFLDKNKLNKYSLNCSLENYQYSNFMSAIFFMQMQPEKLF